MNKKLVPYYNLATQLVNNHKTTDDIVVELKSSGASYAITFRILEKLGYQINEIDLLIQKSKVWDGFERSYEDMFFDFVELDDDLE